ncbi:MAG TPA: hypothetical protein VGK79_05545 [Gaiellaceae bacterium]
MTRSLGLVALVLSLAVGGYLFAQQAKTDGPASKVAQQAEAQASVEAAATSFNAALPTLQAWFEDNGTYAGVSLPPAYGVAVARADASSFCLQTADRSAHESGPNGTPSAGPC